MADSQHVSHSEQPPVILAFGALDPSGGGGVQADIETAASLGAHCAPVATALCINGDGEAQPTVTQSIDSTILIEQARSILEDMPVAAIKVGFTGSVANAEAIHSILRDYPTTPVVLHPALCLWDKEASEQANLVNALSELLIPQSTLISLTLAEIRQMAPEADTLDASAQAIINRGCECLLVTGTGAPQRLYMSSLYNQQGLLKQYQWEQTAPCCHGSSSTLAASLATYLGHQCPVVTAVEQAQNYTWRTLVAARQLGSGRPIPHRLFWADEACATQSSPPADKSTH